MTEEKTNVVLFGEEKQEINATILKRSIEYMDGFIRELASPSVDVEKFLSKYDYTLEDYIEALREGGRKGIARGIKAANRSEGKTDVVHPKDKEAVDFGVRYLGWWIRAGVRQVSSKWFNTGATQGNIECALNGRKKQWDFFNKLSLRVFEHYRTAAKSPYAAHIVGELPIMFLGEMTECLTSNVRIMTLGRAPSPDEFQAGTDRFLQSSIDYAKLFLPMTKPWETNQYLVACHGYFRRTPNWDYFRKFNPLLEELIGGYLCESNRDVKRNSQRKARKVGLEQYWLDVCKAPMERRWGMLSALMPLRSIAVHFNYYTPIALDRPWEELDDAEKRTFSMEDLFPEILDVMEPDIIVSDFDISGTCLAEGAKKTTVPSGWDLTERYRDITAYLRGKEQYILVLTDLA